MKTRHGWPTGWTVIAALAAGLSVQARVAESLALETRMALERATAFLLERQAENGSWTGEPAITALVVQALYPGDSQRHREAIDQAVDRGRAFMLQAAQPDGSFVGLFSPYVNYTTSACLSALAVLGRPEDEEIMRKARRFLINLQLREDHPEHSTPASSPFYGGIGYGSGGPEVPDINNTKFALEALYLSDYLARDGEAAEASQAAWRRAMRYLRSVQRIPAELPPGWEPDKENEPLFDGGFVYRPDQCRVRGKLTSEFDGEPLSYGTATFCGLSGLLFGGVGTDDPRVQAAIAWAKDNYTLDENPVIGAEGHFSYLWTFAKAMHIYGEDTLRTSDGQERNWRKDVLEKLLALQQAEGQWINPQSGRYMEGVPELTTAYAMIAMRAALSTGPATPPTPRQAVE